MTPTIITSLEKLLFGLLILFLPSNLAYHFNISTAIIQGTLVDYLIPKIYLTDIFILGILLLQGLSLKSRTVLTVRRMSLGQLLLILFFFITLITSLLTKPILPSLWFWLKLLEMTLFVWWIVKSQIFRFSFFVFRSALILSVLWQSLLAIAQWLKQSSVLGYLFLGEPIFSIGTPGIAKTSFAGVLKVLPYGTTPHPNVLAGFLAVSLVIIWLNSKSNLSKYITSLLGLLVLFLTQSLSAWLSLILIVLFSNLKSKLLIISLFLAGIGSFFILDTESLSRRHQLNLVAFKIWLNHPLFGVGLNRFVVYLPKYTEISASTRFLQPVHNIYLLILSETGLVGVGLLFFALLEMVSLSNHWKLKIPLLMFLIIGLVDHYPFTLQQGQLLTALAFALATSPK